MQVSPRFGILLGCMGLSVICIVVDLLSVTPVIPLGVINPFWKFAFVFKCFTDSIILDDFKTALDKLSDYSMGRILPIGSLGGITSIPRKGSIQQASRWRERNEPSMGRAGMKVDTEAGYAHVELSDVGGLCSPDPVAISYVERQYR